MCVYNQVDGSRPRQKQRKWGITGQKMCHLGIEIKKERILKYLKKCEAMLVTNKERIWEIRLIFLMDVIAVLNDDKK